MEQDERNELHQLAFKKLDLSSGDNFILKHENWENQNKYRDIIFTFDGKNIYPFSRAVQIKKDDNERLLIALMMGKYEIVKI